MSCVGFLFNMIAEHSEGTVTLNHMRVIQHITVQTNYHDHAISHKDICDSLKLSPATVTRIITYYRELRIVREWSDPDDGRKKYVKATGSGPVTQAFDKAIKSQVAASVSMCPLLSWIDKPKLDK
jgi:DNA-binding MarR family transcriptional regulator